MTTDLTPQSPYYTTGEERPEEESTIQSLIPWPFDDFRARYLGLRASGFRTREALRLLQLSDASLTTWRKREDFVLAETRVTSGEFRKQIGLEYARIAFLRNFCLFTEKDYQLTQKSMKQVEVPIDGNGTDTGATQTVSQPLTQQEHQYLLKARSFYTPQQIQVFEAMILGESSDEPFDWVKAAKAVAALQSQPQDGTTTIKATERTIEVSSVPNIPHDSEA